MSKSLSRLTVTMGLFSIISTAHAQKNEQIHCAFIKKLIQITNNNQISTFRTDKISSKYNSGIVYGSLLQLPGAQENFISTSSGLYYFNVIIKDYASDEKGGKKAFEQWIKNIRKCIPPDKEIKELEMDEFLYYENCKLEIVFFNNSRLNTWELMLTFNYERF